MLVVQNFFRTEGFETAKSILESMDICVRTEIGSNKKTYIHLDYGIKSPKDNPMVKECRGLVLDGETFNVVRIGFYRFLNWGETYCDSFNWDLKTSPIFCEEKCDGSLMILHYIPGIGWNVGTRGRVFPDAKIQGFDITFPQLFWSVFNKSNMKFIDSNRNIQYVFEICSPLNRIVKRYEKPVLYLTNAWRIQNDTLHEISTPSDLDAFANKIDVMRPKSYFFNSIESVLSFVKSLKTDDEGIVIKQFNDEENRYHRAKIKSENYISLHNITFARSLNNLLKLVLNESRASLNDFPEYLKPFDIIYNTIQNWCLEAEKTFINAIPLYDTDGDEKNRKKEFALAVKDSEFGKFCFAKLNDRNLSARDFISSNLTSGKIKNIISSMKIDKIVGDGWKIVENENEDL